MHPRTRYLKQQSHMKADFKRQRSPIRDYLRAWSNNVNRSCAASELYPVAILDVDFEPAPLVNESFIPIVMSFNFDAIKSETVDAGT